MDNFDFKKYLASGRIHQDHDQINEKKEDSKKGNKEEQKRLEGAIRDNRDHKFNIDKDEDEQRKKLAKLKKDSKKESGKGKKGNEDEQKRAEGAIKDAKDHKKNLDKDIKANEKKLAKLKKDFKKDVVKESEEVSEKKMKQGYKDREDESDAERLGSSEDSAGVGSKKHKQKDERDLSYGKYGKRDAEKKGKNKINKENVELNEFDAGVVAVGAPIVMSVVAAGVAKMGYDAVMDLIKAKFPKEDAKYSAEENIEVSMSEEEEVSEYGKKPMYDEDDVKPMKESSKMKKSDLKAKIKEAILSELTLAEDGFEASDAGSQYHAGLYNEAEEDVDVDIDDEEEVDVDVDVEDEVSVAAGGDDIEIERPAVKAKVQVGLSPEEEIVQDSLKAAMDAADALGNDKLADQIRNTITFFTREYVVGRNSD